MHTDSENANLAALSTSIRALERLLADQQRERKSARRRRYLILFTLLLLIGGVFLSILLSDRVEIQGNHAALIRLDGPIGSGVEGNADNLLHSLEQAYSNSEVKGIILRINSPGGSVVESDRMHQGIRRLRTQHPEIPFYVAIGDICASGGYYVAVAATEIYANPNSLVGSIGVLLDSFGFVDTLKKLGIERRLLTAGEHKGMLDPFLPLSAKEKRHIETMMGQMHAAFINIVKQGRGDRLSPDEDVFSGLIWTGIEAERIGLVDGLADSNALAREKIGVQSVYDYTLQEPLVDRLSRILASAFARAFTQLSANNSMQIR